MMNMNGFLSFTLSISNIGDQSGSKTKVHKIFENGLLITVYIPSSFILLKSLLTEGYHQNSNTFYLNPYAAGG